MALVYRNGRPYLYRSVRRGGRVTSEYMAGGVDALLIANLEADEQHWKRFDREQARSERKQLDDLDRALDDLAERARDLAREALTAAGYHLHHRSEWRKRRVQDTLKSRNARERMMDNWAVERLIDWAAGKKGNAKTKESLKEELCDVAAESGRAEPKLGRDSARRDAAATCWFAFRLHEAAIRERRDRRKRESRSPSPSTLNVAWIERTADF